MQALDLGHQGFAGLMGGNDVESATADFCTTMATGVRSVGLTMQVLTQALSAGAASYSQCEGSVVGVCAPKGSR